MRWLRPTWSTSYPPGLDLKQTREQALEGDGDVAEADRAVPGVEQRPRHDPDRVGEIDDPGARSRPLSRPARLSRARPGPCAAPSRSRRPRSSPGRCSRIRSGTVSSARRAAWPPTRICRSTKSAPSSARSRSPVSTSSPVNPWRASIRPARPPTTWSRSRVDVVQGELADVEPLALQARDELGRVRRAAADDRDLHPLTPVRVMPSTKTFCARKKITITGSITSTVAAMVRFHCTWCRLRNCDRPMDTGQLCRSPWPT